jgi:hypothetical protein
MRLPGGSVTHPKSSVCGCTGSPLGHSREPPRAAAVEVRPFWTSPAGFDWPSQRVRPAPGPRPVRAAEDLTAAARSGPLRGLAGTLPLERFAEASDLVAAGSGGRVLLAIP